MFDDSGNHRKERIAQKLFYGIADSYCQANDIGLSPETNSGRGAVDFKFNIGYNIRAIVEVKLTSNKRLDHGYYEQINEYLKAEQNSYPFYLVIDNSNNPKRFIDLKNKHSSNLSKGINCPELIVVDANLKPTASKINKNH